MEQGFPSTECSAEENWFLPTEVKGLMNTWHMKNE